MAKVSAGASHEDTDTDSTRNTYGTRTPNLSEDWTEAFQRSSGNLNDRGFTGGQQSAYDFAVSRMGANNPVNAATTTANTALGTYNNALMDGLGALSQYKVAAPRQLGDATLAQATDAAYAGDVSAGAGADFMDRYKDPYEKDVVNATIDDYGTFADRSLNAMRLGRDASGAFGDRAAGADAVYMADATRGLGSLVSGIRSQGFNNRVGYGMADRNAKLLADQGNQTTRQGVNTFNAGQRTGVSQYNAGLLDSRDKFNVDAGYRGDQQSIQAITAMQDNLRQQAGLTQQQLDNVITTDGVNAEAARALFEAGQIGQEQLNQLLAMAGAGNGYSYTENADSHTDTNTDRVNVGTSFGIG